MNKNIEWVREGYKVVMVDFDFDLKEFKVVNNDGKEIGRITPCDINDMNYIIEELNEGECVDGWEDGRGGMIHIN